MKVVLNGTTPSSRAAREIEPGVVFRGRIGNVSGTFVRGFEVIVCLDDPSNTWTGDVLVLDFVEYLATVTLEPKK